MNRLFFRVIVVLMVLAASQSRAGEVFDRILAVVNDEIITQSEFDKHLVLATLGADPATELDVAARRQLLEQLVERKLLVQEARRLNITVKDQDLDTAMQNILTRNSITLRQLQRQLEDAGLMLEDVRAAVREELITSELIGREVHARVIVSDADMERYYRENIAPGEGRGARARLKQILLQAPGDATDEQLEALRERAESIRAQLEAGASFEQLAAEYSQCPSAARGGDLGFFYKGQLLPAIEEAAFSMPLDTVSPVIRSTIGFHIIVVTSRDSGETEPGWKTHERDIRPVLYSRAFEKVYTKWYAGLRERSHVEIKY